MPVCLCKEWFCLFQMHVKRDGSVQGPLKAHEIREIVESKYQKVGIKFCVGFKCLGINCCSAWCSQVLTLVIR